MYDPSGNVLSSTPPQPSKTVSGKPSGVVTDTYNADEQLASRTNGQGIGTSYQLDAVGDVVSSSSRGVVTTATYNSVGWATGTSTTTRSYDPNQDSAGGTSTPDTTTTKTTYDLAGDVLSKQDAAGGTTTYAYVAGHHVGSVTDHYGTTKYNYDAMGDKTSVTSPSGGVTSYTYDALGRETTQTIGAQTWTISYDADDNPIQTGDPDGRIAKYTYDASNRKTSVNYSWASGHSGPQASPVHWTYDKFGERTLMTDGQGKHQYTYDNQGRLVRQETDPTTGAAAVFTYNYSTPNQLLETYPDGAAITYKTDDGGNLLSLSVPAQKDGSPAFKTGSTLPNTLVTQGSSSAATSGSSAGKSTTMQPSGTLYPDNEFGYMFTTPSQSSITTQPTFATGDAFYSASMVNNADSSNPDNPQAAYEGQSDANGNLLEELWQPLPSAASGGTDTSSAATYYGYNGGAVERSRVRAGRQRYRGSPPDLLQLRLFRLRPGPIRSGWNLRVQRGRRAHFDHRSEPRSLRVLDARVRQQRRDQQRLQHGDHGHRPGATVQLRPRRQPDRELPRAAPRKPRLVGHRLDLQVRQRGSARHGERGREPDHLLLRRRRQPRQRERAGGRRPQPRQLQPDVDPRTEKPQLAEVDEPSESGGQHQRYFWGNGLVGVESSAAGAGGENFVVHNNQNGTPTMISNTAGQSVGTIFDDPYGNYLHGTTELVRGDGSGQPELIGFDGSYSDPLTTLDLMGSRWYNPALGMFMSRPSATAPDTGSSSMTSGANSTVSQGMSASPGTASSLPVAPAATSYVFAADDPTAEAQPTGNTLAPAATATQFAGTSGSESIVSKASVVKPFISGPLAALFVISPLKLAFKGLSGELSQSPNAAVQAAAGTEGALAGSTAPEAAALEAQAGNDASDLATAGKDAARAASKTGWIAGALGKVITVGAISYTTYETEQTCATSGGLQCAGAILGEVISYGALAACEAATDGVATIGCGILQNALANIVPLIVTGNGQALLDSVMFNSGFSLNDGETLAGQLILASALGPWGAAALLGEVTYANWSSIQSGLVTAGDQLLSGLETAGELYLMPYELAGGYVVSGISTAGEEIASGLSGPRSELSSLNFSALASEIANLGSQAASVADSVGSALCDFAQDFSCFFSSVFALKAQERAARLAASEARVPSGAGGSRGPRAAHAPLHLKPLNLSRAQRAIVRRAVPRRRSRAPGCRPVAIEPLVRVDLHAAPGAVPRQELEQSLRLATYGAGVGASQRPERLHVEGLALDPPGSGDKAVDEERPHQTVSRTPPGGIRRGRSASGRRGPGSRCRTGREPWRRGLSGPGSGPSGTS